MMKRFGELTAVDVIDRGELAEALRHPTHLDDRFAVFHLDLNSTSTG